MLLDLWKKTTKYSRGRSKLSVPHGSFLAVRRASKTGAYREGRDGGVQDTSVCCRHEKVAGEQGPDHSLPGNQPPFLLHCFYSSVRAAHLSCEIPTLARRKGLALPETLLTPFN